MQPAAGSDQLQFPLMHAFQRVTGSDDGTVLSY